MPFTSIMEVIMKKTLTMPQFLAVCFITILSAMCLCTYFITNSIEDLTDTVRETKQEQQISMDELTVNQQQQVMDIVANEEPEEVIVPVVYEKEGCASIYTFGDITDKFYLTVLICEEDGAYVYDAPNMCENRIYCDSLAELEEWIVCHLEQAWPDARFVMDWRY
jgi:hypothetical protein